MVRDLRAWIVRLEKEGELKRIRASVDWNGEIGEIHRQVIAKRGPALLFENVKGHENSWCRKLFVGGIGTMGRVALMLNMPKDSSYSGIVQLLRKRFTEPVKPSVVATGPVKDNIIRSDEVDLNQIPVPKWHELDGGRYINTWCVTVTADPDTGRHNAGVYRGMIGGKNKISLLMASAQNWGAHFERYGRMGRPMPVAVVYGWDPSMVFAAGIPVTGDEYGLMGALMQEPVELVKCETSELKVPASAEIVIEGTIAPDQSQFEMEGPYGESTGYYGPPRKRPVIRVDCITYRDDPIFRGGTNESASMVRVGDSALIWNCLERQDIPGILDVEFGPLTVVKIRKTYQGQAKHVAAALWGSRSAVTRLKTLVVVDDERQIDIHDPIQVNRAISYNVAAERGIVVFPMELGAPTDPALSPDAQDETKYGQPLQNKLLIDATVDWTTHPRNPDWGGRRVSPDSNQASAELSQLVQKRWKEYGLSDAASTG